jgi:hypothetical protein
MPLLSILTDMYCPGDVSGRWLDKEWFERPWRRREKQVRWDVPQNISGRHDDRSQCIRTWRGSVSCRIHKYLCYSPTSASPLHCAISSGENGEHIDFAFSRMFVPWINVLTEVLVLCWMCPLPHTRPPQFLYGISPHGCIVSVANHILDLQSNVLSTIHTLVTSSVTQLSLSNRLARW